MKIFHISDLHLGKSLKEYSFIEDQEYILNKIIDKILEGKPDVLIIAGDIYDTSNPSLEAVRLWDSFITRLSNIKIKTLVIAGNHDQATRLAYAKEILKAKDIYISSSFTYPIECKTFSKDDVEVDFYMLPFSRQREIREYFPDANIDTYSQAFKLALNDIPDDDRIKVIIAHQFICGGQSSDSELITSVGGQEQIDIEPFKKFDYVALGHLHRPQSLENGKICYSGSILKYSFSEVNTNKSISCVDIKSKDDITISKIPLLPCTDMIEIKGKFDVITDPSYVESVDSNAYMRIILTDEGIVYDAFNRLKQYYKNLLNLVYDEQESNEIIQSTISMQDAENLSPTDIINRFFETKQGAVLSNDQMSIVNDIIHKVWGENK